MHIDVTHMASPLNDSAPEVVLDVLDAEEVPSSPKEPLFLKERA